MLFFGPSGVVAVLDLVWRNKTIDLRMSMRQENLDGKHDQHESFRDSIEDRLPRRMISSNHSA